MCLSAHSATFTTSLRACVCAVARVPALETMLKIVRLRARLNGDGVWQGTTEP